MYMKVVTIRTEIRGIIINSCSYLKYFCFYLNVFFKLNLVLMGTIIELVLVDLQHLFFFYANTHRLLFFPLQMLQTQIVIIFPLLSGIEYK